MQRLGAAQLRSLLTGPCVKLLHANSLNEELQVLYPKIPKGLVVYFSPMLRDRFPNRGVHHVNTRGCDGRTMATIYGGLREAHIIVLDCMLRSCNGKGFAKIEYLNFGKYARIFDAAVVLGVQRIQNDMLARMNKMASTQIRIDDVKIIYGAYPKDSIQRQIVIRSIGDAVFDRWLRGWAHYKEFRIESREYDEDIYEYVQNKKRAIAERGQLDNNNVPQIPDTSLSQSKGKEMAQKQANPKQRDGEGESVPKPKVGKTTATAGPWRVGCLVLLVGDYAGKGEDTESWRRRLGWHGEEEGREIYYRYEAVGNPLEERVEGQVPNIRFVWLTEHGKWVNKKEWLEENRVKKPTADRPRRAAAAKGLGGGGGGGGGGGRAKGKGRGRGGRGRGTGRAAVQTEPEAGLQGGTDSSDAVPLENDEKGVEVPAAPVENMN
ncbi:hypothetical protein FQN57_004747 [Myotisia sp. PD_48]|nr:hypothetical protein FQN57_004747 [Myotisia sp. PD_48]